MKNRDFRISNSSRKPSVTATNSNLSFLTKVAAFDEFVRYMEDENKKWVESNKAWLEEKGLWEYVH